MDLEFSPGQHALRRSVKALLASFDNLSRNGCSSTRWEALARGGFLRAGLPIRVGGSADPIDTMIMAEELGWALAAAAYPDTVVVAGSLLANAPNAQFDHLVKRIVSGAALVAVAWDEPGERCGADTCLIATPTATGWRLDGRKPLVAGAAAAEHWIVEAHIETVGRERALFVIGWDKAGIERIDYPTIDGRQSSDVRLSGVEVDAQQLIAGPESTRCVVDYAIDAMIAAHCAEAVGVMRRMLADTIAHCKQRQQFGQPLSSFQVLQHRMVDMELQIAMAASATLRASLSLDLPPEERARAMSAAKVTVATAGRFIGENAIQLHGGLGMRDETPVTHYFRRTIAMESELGGIDWHLDRFARHSAAVESQP